MIYHVSDAERIRHAQFHIADLRAGNRNGIGYNLQPCFFRIRFGYEIAERASRVEDKIFRDAVDLYRNHQMMPAPDRVDAHRNLLCSGGAGEEGGRRVGECFSYPFHENEAIQLFERDLLL